MKSSLANFSSRRRGFTLVEILVVTAIIGILAALLLPSIARALRSAQQVRGASNLHQIGVAMNLAAQDNNNRFPPGNITTVVNPDGSPATTNAGFSYFIGAYMGFSTVRELNASRVLVDPLAVQAAAIATGTQLGGTYSSNQRVTGIATSAVSNLSSVTYSGTGQGLTLGQVLHPSRTILLGAAVTQEGKVWGSNNTFGHPDSLLHGTDPDVIVPPETGSSVNTGGVMGGVGYRADENTAAMFLMVDGGVQVIRQNTLTVGQFMPDH